MHDFFLGIQGQENALNILSELHSKERIPNALLFSGVEGCGKFFTAIQFLKLLNKDTSSSALHKFDSLSEPFVKLIFPLPRGKGEDNSDLPTSKLNQDILEDISDQIKLKAANPYHKINIANANNIKINSIKEINKIISLNFDEITYRGIIISDAHKMSIEAQNAFLKNLEEPPEGIIYILLTDNPDNLLTTIKSRCWEINFAPLSNKNLESILTGRYNFSRADLEDVLPFANGSVSNALFLIENDIQKYLARTILILRYSLARKFQTAFKEFNDVMDQNSVKSFQIIIDLILAWLNDSIKEKFNLDNISFNKYKETLEKFNARFKSADISLLTSKLVEYRNSPNRNVNLNILVMNVIFELASLGMKKI